MKTGTSATGPDAEDEKMFPADALRLQQAAALYGRSDFARAENLCRQLLQDRPGQPDALHILGLIAWRRGDQRRALDELRSAVARYPRRPALRNSLGVMLRELGELADAEVEFRAALALRPNYSEAFTNLGNILCDTGRLVEAAAAHRSAVELTPKYANAWNNLATALSKQGLWSEAVDACQAAIELEPTRAEFHLNLGNALSTTERWEEAAVSLQRAVDLAPGHADARAGLGIALYRLGQYEPAIEAYRQALQLRPQSARTWADLGASLAKTDRFDEAVEACRRALDLDPKMPQAHNSLGKVFVATKRLSEAEEAFKAAIALRPDYASAYCNLGLARFAAGRFAEARMAYDKAIELDPEFREALWNKSILHLLLGDFETGWSLYEYGIKKRSGSAGLRFEQYPQWRGNPTVGKTLFLWGEQGIGDQIMFASLVPELQAQGARCVIEAEARLEPLFRRSFGDIEFVPRSIDAAAEVEKFSIDYQVPMGNLCRWLRPNLASFTKREAYLRPDPTQASALRARYRARYPDKPIVGISWTGGTGTLRRARSIPLQDWSSILRLDVGFVSLQYGDCAEDLASLVSGGINVLYDATVDPLKDLDSFAAQTAAMDLVISVDNSTVHTAGALNVPTWVMLPEVPDWRWLLERSDSPWYPSVRLFRQSRMGDWAPVLTAIARELANFRPRKA